MGSPDVTLASISAPGSEGQVQQNMYLPPGLTQGDYYISVQAGTDCTGAEFWLAVV